jgi:sporulation protein YpjB
MVYFGTNLHKLMVKEECPMFVFLRDRKWILLIVLSTLFIVTAACGAATNPANLQKGADPQQQRKLELLSKTADDMYRKAMDGQMMEARNALLQLSDQITHLPFQGAVSIEGLNALTAIVTQAKRAFNAAALSPNEGQIAAAQIRLATDALTHKNQPMWLQYDKVLRNDLALLTEAAKVNKEQEALKSFSNFNQHIYLIHPSLLISRDPSEVEKLDSLLSFVQTQMKKKPIAYQNVVMAAAQLQLTLDEIFDKNQETTAYLPIGDHKQPIIWALGIGAIISAILTFAGWRMFKGDHSMVSVDKEEEG